MYPPSVRLAALDLLRARGLSEVSRMTGVHRSTLRVWLREPVPVGECPRCDAAPLPASSYAALLGYYLGDGCVSRHHRYFTLRVSCDARYPAIVSDVDATIGAVRPAGRVFRVRAPGVLVVQSNWQHWPCLFPQHGPGRKHERPIVLEPWQVGIVEAHPAAFLRGLFHSPSLRPSLRGLRSSEEIEEGRHARSAATRVRPVSKSLDRATWQSNHETISNRTGVARLDALIGLKA